MITRIDHDSSKKKAVTQKELEHNIFKMLFQKHLSV